MSLGYCGGCGQEVEVTPEGLAAGREEAAALFVDGTPLDALVCDDCWPEFLSWMRVRHPEAMR